ncbi:HEAT repeat domain-containing protein [Trichloromonas sp.]|uniref:HEAT repeat domain-containing protein n=1 Tax=Trichloromonas sp. TaxID=3069249 RepID=UPI002A478C22|nr:HEAT repeat domain-containing protein [Trichloromonas sp.]
MDIAEILEKKLGSDDEEARIQAVRELADLGSHLPMALLYRAMGDASWRVRKEASETFIGLSRAGELAEDVVELLHAQDNAGLRNVAVDILVRLGSRALPVLHEEITCSDADVRKFILDILGEIGDSASLAVMTEALADSDRNVRAAAAENLGKLRNAEALSPLLEAMEEADLLMRFTILEALGLIGHPLPLERIRGYVEDPLLRKALFDCLGQIDMAEGASLLASGLGDRMGNVREAAVLSLGALYRSQPQAVAEALARDSKTADLAMAEALASSRLPVVRAALRLVSLVPARHSLVHLLPWLADEELGRKAARAILSLGRPAVVSLLQDWSNQSERLQAFLCYLAAETGAEEAIEPLLKALDSDNQELVLAAAHALGRLRVVAALPALTEVLRREDAEARRVAQEALGVLAEESPEAFLTALAPLMEDARAETRMAAIAVLGKVNFRMVRPMVFLALKDDSAEVRRSAVSALGGNPDIEQLDALVLALTDEDADVRRIAAEVLGSLRDRRAVDALALALHDEDPWVRATVLRAIGAIGSDRAGSLIREALGDPVGLVCIAALEAWFAFAPDGAFPHLIASLYHDDEEVVGTALALLVTTGRRDWLPAMAEVLINHPHWEVRLRFAQALEQIGGASCRELVENRLLVEGEELVHAQLEQTLESLGEEG